ncbi:hypothetical protein ACFWHQ_37880 [Streptomyces sp. NPDC060334]|uniref:hypothetical protein n=1 Tax=unclassified Streptomyces TaxID=2593676 RepID=UPI00364E6C79
MPTPPDAPSPHPPVPSFGATSPALLARADRGLARFLDQCETPDDTDAAPDGDTE